MAEKGMLIQWSKSNDVKLKCRLDLSCLFDSTTANRFREKYREFLKDGLNNKIYRRESNQLFYDSEQLIPAKWSRRIPLLLVLGNPASHSVQNGMFFAYEGKGQDHRFWKSILKPIADFELNPRSIRSTAKVNQIRKQRLLDLDYESHFIIALAVMLTMPSAPGGKWGGVQGIQRLLGRRAYRKVLESESKRVTRIAKTFIKNGGAVIAFQKDAWETLRCERSAAYSIEKAKSNELIGRLKGAPDIPLYGVPPTRLSGPCQNVIGKIAIKLKKRAPYGDV